LTECMRHTVAARLGALLSNRVPVHSRQRLVVEGVASAAALE
jgi:hypothetical protein